MVERKKTTDADTEKVPEVDEVQCGADNGEGNLDSEGCASSDGEGKVTPERIIKKHVLFSMGVGLVPVPLLDIVAITGVQLMMLRKLAEIYEVPFSEHKVKSILSSLVGGGVTVPVARTLLSFTKMIPVVGQASGLVAMPITAGATTFAVGKVFDHHFSSGGTFLTFDSEKAKEHYNQFVKKGKEVASEMKDTAKDAATEMKDAAKDAATEVKDAAKGAATETKK